jgi:hypothetical protein
MRRIHLANKLSTRGASALCFPKPRAIDMKRATWTTSPAAVTCPKCLARLAGRSKSPQGVTR